jgi:hypothetical protein
MTSPSRFPIELVRFEHGIFVPWASDGRLESFELNAVEMIVPVRGSFPVFEAEAEEIATSIVASFGAFRVRRLQELSGEWLRFPINPTEGYIDGSIYLANVHNPVDITALKFGPVNDGTVHVDVEAELLFEFERSPWTNCQAKFHTILVLTSNRQ